MHSACYRQRRGKKTGIPYLSKYPDQLTNVAIRPVARPLVMSNFFRYGVKSDHYEKLIDIRELSEQLAQDCFNNNFLPDRGTLENNPPPLMRSMMETEFLIS